MVYFYYGEDNYSGLKELKSLKEKALARDPNVLVERIDLHGDFTDAELVSRLRDLFGGAGLFSAAKFAVISGFVSNAKKFPRAEEFLLESLPGLDKTISIIFYEDGNPDKRLKFFKSLKKFAEAREFAVPAGAELEKWIRQYLSDFDYEIEAPALRELRERLEGHGGEVLYSLWQVAGELDKLMLLHPDNKSITAGDVKQTVSPNITDNIFALTNLFADGEKKKSIALLEDMLAGSGGAELKTQSIQIIGGLAGQLRSLLAVKNFESRPPGEAARELGWKEGRVWINLKLAKKFSVAKLKTMISDLAAIDRRLKTSEEPPRLLLSLFLAKK